MALVLKYISPQSIRILNELFNKILNYVSIQPILRWLKNFFTNFDLNKQLYKNWKEQDYLHEGWRKVHLKGKCKIHKPDEGIWQMCSPWIALET